MTDSNKPRLAIDLDDIERQLRRSAEQPAPKKDPLAELARIVGQDDPFRKLLGETDGSASRASESAERLERATRPVIGRPGGAPDNESAFGGPQPGAAYEPYRAPQPDAFAEPAYEPIEENLSEQDLDEYEPAPPPRSRRGLLAAGAIVAVAALGVTGFLMTRGTGARVAGTEPPLVKADSGPLKVAPQNPGGVEIPNQNRQIFERGQESQTRVVDRQEQPVDVRQAVRSMPQNPAASPGGSVPSVTPPPSGAPAARPNTVVSALGEPKRVRTVTVRPDGTLDTPATTASADPSPASASPAPAPPPSTVPSASSGATPSSAPTAAPAASPSTAPSRPRPPATQSAGATPPVSPAVAPDAASSRNPVPRMELPRLNLGDTPAATPAPAPVPARSPPAVAALPAPRAPAAEPVRRPAAEAATGGFSVQIGTRPSEAEGRAAFEQIASRFPAVLGGRQALIRRAELNGKTIFRVRVGPATARADAVDLCVRLKAAGGECFVAAN